MKLFAAIMEAVCGTFALVFFMSGDHARAAYFMALCIYMHMVGRDK